MGERLANSAPDQGGTTPTAPRAGAPGWAHGEQPTLTHGVHHLQRGRRHGEVDGVCFVAADHVAATVLGDGFLRANETAYIGTELPAADDTRGVVSCIDEEQIAHAWNLAGDEKTFRFKGATAAMTAVRMYALHYPDDDLSRMPTAGVGLGSPPGSPY